MESQTSETGEKKKEERKREKMLNIWICLNWLAWPWFVFTHYCHQSTIMTRERKKERRSEKERMKERERRSERKSRKCGKKKMVTLISVREISCPIFFLACLFFFSFFSFLPSFHLIMRFWLMLGRNFYLRKSYNQKSHRTFIDSNWYQGSIGLIFS